MRCAARAPRRRSAFGDPTVILERAIVDPRHIEIQVFGDRYGNAIHLGERDCSVQRRHQKLIEEAPSPAVTPELRARMGAIAVNAIKSLRYRGRRHAGIPARSQRRILFHGDEHPPAGRASRHRGDHRARSGRTAIARRRRRAARHRAGGRQILRPCDRGAAVLGGCRAGFHAAIGPDGAVADAGYLARRACAAIRLRNSAVLRFDDRQADQPWRRPRSEARRKLVHGLEQTVAFGVTTNQAFLAACLRHPVFASGEATTSFIGSHRDELLAPRQDAAAEAALAALLLYVTDIHAPPWRSGRSLAATFPVPVRVELDHGIHEVELSRQRDGGYLASREGGEHRFEIDALGGRYHPLPQPGPCGIRQLFPRRRPALSAAPGHHAGGPRSHAGRAGRRRGDRQRRQGPRRHERPRRRGAGQARATRSRPASRS